MLIILTRIEFSELSQRGMFYCSFCTFPEVPFLFFLCFVWKYGSLLPEISWLCFPSYSFVWGFSLRCLLPPFPEGLSSVCSLSLERGPRLRLEISLGLEAWGFSSPWRPAQAPGLPSKTHVGDSASSVCWVGNLRLILSTLNMLLHFTVTEGVQVLNISWSSIFFLHIICAFQEIAVGFLRCFCP